MTTMDLTGSGTTTSGSSGGAVACPVCTLYLREGISLQRHLDTHPKEQVIEALIKASSVVSQTQQVTSSPSTSTISSTTHTIQNPQHVTQTAHVSSQSPYPVGPIFECPPIGTMMPPQFASFSYQQFVNNGTMMIPQYAMAPQANQMMQMLYNPYGMYQQQQIPTVQMISPVTAIPNATRIRPVVNMAGDSNNRTTITVPVSNSEPKQILPEILAESEAEAETEAEAEQVLPDINFPDNHGISNENTSIQQEETESSKIEHTQHTESQQVQNAKEQSITQCEYNSIPRSVTITCNLSNEDEDHTESVLPDLEDTEATEIAAENLQCRSNNYEGQPEKERFTEEYENNHSKDNIDIEEVIMSNIDKESEKSLVDSASNEKENDEESSSVPSEVPLEQEAEKSSTQPEVEQLERLLITIIESEFSDTQMKDKSSENNEEINDSVMESSAIETEEVNVVSVPDNKNDSEQCNIESKINMEPKIHLNTEADNSYALYHYKYSISAPASPVSHKRSYKTYSVRSDFGSNENLSVCATGIDETILQDDNDEHRKEIMEDNFDEVDIEMENIPSPHTPFMKYGESSDRSHTPLSAISGISVLRVRKDLSKPCSPMSVHSFCHMDTDSMHNDERSNNLEKTTVEKDPIDCSSNEKEKEEITDNYTETTTTKTVQDKKDDTNNMYYQSVISERANSFSPLHSQQPILIQESYSLPSNKSHNLLNLSESNNATSSTESKSHYGNKSIAQKQSELLNINEDAHSGPMNVFEFDGLQILVPSTFICESSQKAVSATSQQSMASSEGGTGVDEEVKSVNMRADETMPARGELSEQESNGCTEQSAWQLYMGQESSRMSTSYDLMARESWEESEGSDNEISGPLLDSRSLATHFTSSLFLDRDRKTPTKRTYKCTHCPEVFDCPKERRVHSTTVHKEAGPSSSTETTEQAEVKDIKLLDGRMNMFDDIFVPGLHVQQMYHHQQPLLHQLQPPQQDLAKLETDQKSENLTIPLAIEVSCALCSQRFSSEKSLQLHHKRMHIAEVSKRLREQAKCLICNEEFASAALFNAHLKIHPLECGQCGKYFYRKQNYKLHMKRHLGIKPFPCTLCDKAFLTKQKLDEHTNGHTGNAPVKCNLCNETFRRYSNLTQHKNRHHLNIKKKLKDYICHCGEVFHTKKKLAWHKETHDEKPKACTYCNERFIHMASLTRHMRRAHNRRFVPDAQRESENVECPICKCIYLRSSLAVHMRVHNGEKPYECQVCSKAFSTKWNLQLHKWTHAARSTKPFKCNQCSAAFYRHSDYTAHMNSHRNVRPYTCNYCGAQFIRKYNCLRHVKEHEENKAYTCDVCNKTFHRSYYLKEHLRVHSGARPYTCHICGKSSGTKSNHNKHVRIHHAREPVNTEN